MATKVGEIGLDLVVNQKSFNKQMSGITSLAKKTGAALASAFAVKKLVDFGKSCLDLGSDLQEVQNVVDVVFPSMTSQVNKFAQNAATSFGLSETMAKRFSGTYGAMAKAFGFSEKQAYDMGTALTGLAGDVASFYNITQDEAYTKLKSVFTGETETLKDLGVVMTQTALDSYALANGFGKTTKAMSEAEKVALRYQFVQDQLSAAQGDFARTSGSWANQIRILNLQIDSIKANIGQGLINLFTPILKAINTLLAKLSTLAGAFKSFTELITGNKASDTKISGAFSDTAAGLKDAESAASSLGSTTSAIGDAAKKAAKEMKSLMGFDEINKLAEPGNTDTEASSGSTGAGAIGATVDFGNAAEDTGSSFMDNLKSKFEKLDLSKLQNSLKHLREELGKFGEHLGAGLKWLYDNALVPLGKWVISEAAPRFFETLANVLRIFNAVIEALKPLFQWFWDSVLKPLAEWYFGDTFLSMWDAINAALSKFGDWCEKHPGTIQAMATAIAGFWAAWKITGVIATIGEFISAISISLKAIGGLKGALGLLAGSFSPVTLGIGALITAGLLLWQNWDSVSDAIVTAWSNIKTGVSNAAQNTSDFLSRSFEAASLKIKNILSGIKTSFSNAMSNLKITASNSMSNIKQSITTRLTAAKDSATNTLNELKSRFSNTWSNIRSSVANQTSSIAANLRTSFTNAKNSISNILSGIKTNFSNIFTSLVGIVKNPVNSIIRALNKLISGLNQIHFSIPSWVPSIGGKSFGFSIPHIPMLADGGFVEKNTPQLAMIGDNRHQGEVVAPEDKMQGMADQAALKAVAAIEDYIAAMMAGFESVVRAIEEKETNVSIGDEAIGKANDRYRSKMSVIKGGTW